MQVEVHIEAGEQVLLVVHDLQHEIVQRRDGAYEFERLEIDQHLLEDLLQACHLLHDDLGPFPRRMGLGEALHDAAGESAGDHQRISDFMGEPG